MVQMITLNHINISLQLFFYALVLLSVYSGAAIVKADTKCIESERQALLTFKQGLQDEGGFLSSWLSEEDCCLWRGVHCSNRTGHVVTLDLAGLPMEGTLSSSLLELQDLTYLDLTSIDFGGNQIPEFIGYLTKLTFLHLSDANFSGHIPYNVFSNMTSLADLDLSLNHFTAISSSFGDMCTLRTLLLDSNNLTGTLPDLFFNLSGCAKKSLEILWLDGNMLSGSLPDITEFTSLTELHIFNNSLDGSFPKRFRQPSPLVELDLSLNRFWGSLPDLSVFPLLRRLDISFNQLNGTVNPGLGQLSLLEELNLYCNSLQGMITESHMSNLSKLITLDFSYNSLSFNFSDDWIPPFQLGFISLRGCPLGPQFPKWLRSQWDYIELDLSSALIMDTVPDWFWDGLSLDLLYLNLSNNQMKGKVRFWNDQSTQHHFFVPDQTTKNIVIDLSSNCFESSIPPMPSRVSSLFLSNNSFYGSISFLCNITNYYFWILDLSNNRLSGEIPDCSGYWENLILLNLANNNLSGRIPNSMDSFCHLRSLHLRNNNLTGELPSSLKNCKLLTVMDLGNNSFFGAIPPWIDDSFSNLTILSLRSNHFHGNLPPQLCNLANLQVLDVADNNISGTMPKCLNNLTTMVRRESPNAIIQYAYLRYLNSIPIITGPYYTDEAWLVWKGVESEYTVILGLVKSIDLSSNKLYGEIPEEITSLVGLLSLNLSKNSLTGIIPQQIGQLSLLNSLDLSENQLNGKIPESFSQLSSLGVLNLSSNNLSGKIPSDPHLQTFGASSFMGNPNLCGSPLPNKCPEVEPATVDHDSEDDDGFITTGFYITAILGFIVGFWGFCGGMLVNRNWRFAHF